MKISIPTQVKEFLSRNPSFCAERQANDMLL